MKKVWIYNNGINSEPTEYPSIAAAARELGVTPAQIRTALQYCMPKVGSYYISTSREYLLEPKHKK